jgi:hypothetical protein
LVEQDIKMYKGKPRWTIATKIPNNIKETYLGTGEHEMKTKTQSSHPIIYQTK